MQDDVLMTNPESSESQEFTTLPLLALRDVVVYPQMQIALFVGRTPSVKAVELAQNEFDNKVLVVAQKDSLSEDIDASNLALTLTRSIWVLIAAWACTVVLNLTVQYEPHPAFMGIVSLLFLSLCLSLVRRNRRLRSSS